jgi:hypothetical protein
LAACVNSNGNASAGNGHVVVIYDERNPAFQAGGKAFSSYGEIQKSLKIPTTLRCCSWQRIIGLMRDKNILPWLTETLEQKYGLC